MKVLKVAVVAYNRFSPFHLSITCIVFAPQGLTTPHLFDMQLCAGEPGELVSDEGFSCNTEAGLEAVEAADIVIVPGWRDPSDRRPQALLNSLATAHTRGAMVVGLCLGTYVLAYAGLLNGRKASTHWEFEQDFSSRFPCVQLDTNALYVMDRNLLTSAGTAAGLDCCLHVVREVHGSLVANRLARKLVVPPHRDGGQAQYIEQPVPHSTHDALINQLLDFLRANINQELAIDKASNACSCSALAVRSYGREAVCLIDISHSSTTG